MDKQNSTNESKKNRMSFKQFQQHYDEQTVIQKQKRKSQQQGLQKLAINNVKPLQNASKDRVSVVDLSKHKKSLGVSQSKKSIQTFSLTELNSLNSSMAFPSNFVSPKASTQAIMKSINLASNKSRQLGKGNFDSRSKQRLVDAKLNIIPKQNTVINLNCGNQKKASIVIVPINKKQNQNQKEKQRNMKKISSISKMTTTDIGESTLFSFPSQKLLQLVEHDNNSYEERQAKTYQQTIQYVNYLVSEVNFLNQVFKELQNQNNALSHEQKLSQMSYKSKLLAQIRTKLSKQQVLFGMSLKQEQSPVRSLHQTILTLLQNYESDLKQDSYVPNVQNIKPAKTPLQIRISDQPQTQFNLEMNKKREQSKKKTVKLTKSRRTNQQTVTSQSKVHKYFQTSQFSILNTSKITELSRPSSQNKHYLNEIEHVINSKILDNYDQKQQKEKYDQQQRPKYDLINRMKVNLRAGARNSGEFSKGHFNKESECLRLGDNDGRKEMERMGKLTKGQSCDDGKKNTVAKTISLISSTNTYSIDKQLTKTDNNNKHYPSVPKCTKISTKQMKENINSQNISLEPSGNALNIKSVNLISKDPHKMSENQESPCFSQSHNQSIYQLEYLENYSGFHPPSNYSSMEPKYSKELFR